MGKNTSVLKNEKGAVIVFALMILLIVTIVGLSSSRTSTTELLIVRNEGVYKQNLYLAEGAAQEAIQRIWNTSRSDPSQLINRSPAWLNNDTLDMMDFGNWDSDGVDDDDTSLVSALNEDTSLSVIANGIAAGGSLDVTAESNIYDFTIYGLSNHNQGRVLIEIGFRERF
jgi:Tfp pilus assembly protein PilX